MRILSIFLLLTVTTEVANSQSYKEARDIIRWSDFDHEDRVIKTVEFEIGDAAYRLEYYISANPMNDERCFLFNNDKFKGGLLIATDKSDVVSMEIKWNNVEQTYNQKMFMYVTGNETPWESVAQVLSLKNESRVVGKFYSYSLSDHENYGDEDITVITPEFPGKYYAITPGYVGTVKPNNYVFEFIITRRFEADADSGYARVSNISTDDSSSLFVLATENGKLLTVSSGALTSRNCNVDIGNTVYPTEDIKSEFSIDAMNGDEFQLRDMISEKYLTVDATGDLQLTADSPSYFTLTNGVLTHADTGGNIVYDGTKFTTSSVSRASTTAGNPVGMYKSNGSAETGVALLEDYTPEEPQYYTLQGIRLAAPPTASGIYLSRQGSRVAKFLVK